MMKKSYSTWGPSYKVSFSLKINKLPRNRWTNIFHVTKGGNMRRFGDRIPAVWIKKVWKRIYVYVCTAITYKKRSGWGNYIRNYKNFCTTTMVSLGKNYDITIQQSKKRGRYMYQIFISGKRTQSFVSLYPKKFTNVDFYTSDPWYPGFTSDLGTVSDLKIDSQTAAKAISKPKPSGMLNV